jgi:hypothetical protein
MESRPIGRSSNSRHGPSIKKRTQNQNQGRDRALLWVGTAGLPHIEKNVANYAAKPILQDSGKSNLHINSPNNVVHPLHLATASPQEGKKNLGRNISLNQAEGS